LLWVLLSVRKLQDVISPILQRDELATAGQRDWIFKDRFQPLSGKCFSRLPIAPNISASLATSLAGEARLNFGKPARHPAIGRR